MARLVTPIILLASIGIAYWYWTGPFQKSVNTPAADDPKQNARIMARCISEENFAVADGVRNPGENPEEACAEENSLYKFEGNWYRR